jgi:flagellin
VIGGFDADKGMITDLDNIISYTTMFEDSKNGGVDLTMHIGPSGSDVVSMKVGSFNTGALNLSSSGVNVLNAVNTESLLINLDAAIDYVSSQRSELGAMQNRLDSTIASLQVNLETTSASRSRITDADFSTETAGLATAQIIQQASVSILAQANASPNIALALLR